MPDNKFSGSVDEILETLKQQQAAAPASDRAVDEILAGLGLGDGLPLPPAQEAPAPQAAGAPKARPAANKAEEKPAPARPAPQQQARPAPARPAKAQPAPKAEAARPAKAQPAQKQESPRREAPAVTLTELEVSGVGCRFRWYNPDGDVTPKIYTLALVLENGSVNVSLGSSVAVGGGYWESKCLWAIPVEIDEAVALCVNEELLPIERG